MEKVENFQALTELEKHIEALLDKHKRLSEENQLLKKQHETLLAEKAKLIEKTYDAQSKIEAMVNQLKKLEQSA